MILSRPVIAKAKQNASPIREQKKVAAMHPGIMLY